VYIRWSWMLLGQYSDCIRVLSYYV